jgi:DNA invertase Pin-like site-specific DNA recombinase
MTGVGSRERFVTVTSTPGKVSGRRALAAFVGSSARRELLRILDAVVPGDLVTVTRIDRSARSTFGLFAIADKQAVGIDIDDDPR